MGYSAMALVCVAGLLIYYEILALKRKLANLEERMNQFAKLTGYDDSSSFLVSDELKDEVTQLKKNGNMVKAVKVVRESTKMDLIQAKRYVDTLK